MSRTLRCAGVRLQVRIQGRGEPLLLLHGFTGSHRSMAAMAQALEHRFRVFSLDLVGHGGSEAPLRVNGYRMGACVDQVAAALDRLALDRVHVLAYSMGARVALSLAVEHPQRLRSLLLVGAGAGCGNPLARVRRVVADRDLAQRLRAGGLERFVDQWMAHPLFARQRRLGETHWREARQQRLQQRPEALALSLEGMGSGAMLPLQRGLARIPVPALLVAGSADPKFRRLALAIAAQLPRGQVATVAGAGHAAHVEQPVAFRALALAFYARQSHGGGALAAFAGGE